MQTEGGRLKGELKLLVSDCGCTLTWWVHEVEMHQVINAQFLELQHHRAQIRPQDFWIRVVLCQ